MRREHPVSDDTFQTLGAARFVHCDSRMITCLTHKWIRVRYSAPVARCVRRLRVFPPPLRGAQRITNLQWRCEPEADRTREFVDEFGNRVLELCHARIESEFIFALSLTTEHTTASAHSAAREEGLPAAGAGAFLLPSALCDIPDEVQSTVQHLQNTAQIFADDPERSAVRLCAWAHRALKYQPGATDARTNVSQALRRGAGVCQDYAHLMLALCRAAQIPARYVSGYSPLMGNETAAAATISRISRQSAKEPDDGNVSQAERMHAGQMHAWVEALCGDRWLAFDPTHNRRTHPDCVFVACGRDFRDVSPVTGSYGGRATAQLRTRCETIVGSAHSR